MRASVPYILAALLGVFVSLLFLWEPADERPAAPVVASPAPPAAPPREVDPDKERAVRRIADDVRRQREARDMSAEDLIAEHARRDSGRWRRLGQKVADKGDTVAAQRCAEVVERVKGAEQLEAEDLQILIRDERRLLGMVGERRPEVAPSLRQAIADRLDQIDDNLQEDADGQ